MPSQPITPRVGSPIPSIGTVASSPPAVPPGQEAVAIAGPRLPLRRSLSFDLLRTGNESSRPVTEQQRARRASVSAQSGHFSEDDFKSRIENIVGWRAADIKDGLNKLSPDHAIQFDKNFALQETDSADLKIGRQVAAGMAQANGVLRKLKPAYPGAARVIAYEAVVRHHIGVENVTIGNLLSAATKLGNQGLAIERALVGHGVTVAATDGEIFLEKLKGDFEEYQLPNSDIATSFIERAVVKAGRRSAEDILKTSDGAPGLHDAVAFRKALEEAAVEHVPDLKKYPTQFNRHIHAGVAQSILNGAISDSTLREQYEGQGIGIFGQLACAKGEDFMKEADYDIGESRDILVERALTAAKEAMPDGFLNGEIEKSGYSPEFIDSSARQLVRQAIDGDR